MQEAPVLQMHGIRKAFPGVQALDGVDFEVRPGEVMALMGENGAGKSTLIKILSGAHSADEGQVFIKGQQVKISSPKEAQDLGVAVIYQELNLAESVSIAENIFVGREFRNRFGFIDNKTMNTRAREWLETLHIDLDPRLMVRKIGIARKQMVEIAKALSLDASIIVMDEPTSSLPTATSKPTELNEVEVLLEMIRKLRDGGKAVIYISHRMGEVFRISDRITVLRDGKLVGVRNTAETNPDEVVAMMVGRKLEDLYGHRSETPIGEKVLEVRGLNQAGRLYDINFDVRAGEILGLAGLIGAGRSETAMAVFGASKRDSGDILINNHPLAIKNPQSAIQAGIGYLPEDRKLQGLFLKMAIRLNISAADLSLVSSSGFLNANKERELSSLYVKQLNIRTPSIEQQARNLSGGNQQKVVIAKWLAVKPKVLILDEPTRGVDVGAKIEIYNLMHQMASQGMALVMISSELLELLGMSDRILVLREGRAMGELSRADATEEKIMTLATGVKTGS
ncbi:MAG: ABC-type transport system ATP-binding protein (probable substrate ribose) [Chloroflexi bacterium]|nr:ABC-type transport system ATP-binding protein (probable substrate ribose) [Chloroflexota bacterium]